jgi:hypothetical protein
MPKATVDLYFGKCNGTAGFKINQLTIEPNTLAQGTHTLEFEYSYGESIEFMMFGKSNRDTILEHGQIMQDKHVNIVQLKLQYITLENWHFHGYIFDPYFGFNKESRYLHLPDKKDFPIWYIKVVR